MIPVIGTNKRIRYITGKEESVSLVGIEESICEEV